MARNNLFKTLAIVIALAGIVIAFLAVRTRYPSVILGVIISFSLISLFIWNINPGNKKDPKIVMLTIWIIGAISGYMIGHRPYMTAGPAPWKWLPDGAYPAVMVPAHMEREPAFITWALFFIIGITYWLIKKSQHEKAKTKLNIT